MAPWSKPFTAVGTWPGIRAQVRGIAKLPPSGPDAYATPSRHYADKRYVVGLRANIFVLIAICGIDIGLQHQAHQADC